MITWLSRFESATLSTWSHDSRRLTKLGASKNPDAFSSSLGSLAYKPPPSKPIKDRKFLVRDWTPWLGWNNVRYTIETGLLIANLLGRELVLPGFTYATGCDFDDEVCAKLTPMFVHGVPVDLSTVSNRSQYPDPDEGTNILSPLLPSQNWKGWVLPLDVMLDLPYLQFNWNSSISLPEFLQLTSPGTKHASLLGQSSGKWSEHNNNGLSYRKIANAKFTNFSTTVLDRLPLPVEPLIPKDDTNVTLSSSIPLKVIQKCQATLQKVDQLQPRFRQKRDSSKPAQDLTSFPSWNDDLIQGDQMTGELSHHDNDLLERCIASHGYRTAYGYTLDGWWMKAPYGPTKYFRKVETMIGWWDELHAYDESILHIEGELHNGFPPGSMLWTTLEGRQNFEKLVRTAMRPPDLYDRVAAKLEKRMRERCQGRAWRAGHMRRGDFIAYQWTAKNITKQYDRIESNINASVALLKSETGLLSPAHKAYDTSLEAPRTEDPFYLATNVRSKEEIAFLRTKNVVLLNDLLDETDKADLGFSAPFTDTLAIVEQCLIMRSAFFYGDGHSSVAGWILNRRNFFGIDEKLTKIEYLKQPGDGQ
ncbi:uncharacterized protein MELLADRAFT_95062 [Melampsora larici-populina 98AG31]|uniref:Uncharacterized protein n=1 Tax=Melampsora larici-populina (strain 98AG31 / pathotype 3-4-7) TaxID=747676 RepID=F4S8Z3_MELLP|nr:uncharacterized protein MELLADRAFT_95062 [Melampsora larici-populina 98AG31]EGF98906.1 hypothetical protein MELLADRAFT_95062 [Melampsora larici-populina 98AG31]